MSASQPSNMRDPRMKTPLLLLLLVTTLTATVLCHEDTETQKEDPGVSGDTETDHIAPNSTLATNASSTKNTGVEEKNEAYGSGRHRSLETEDYPETTEYPISGLTTTTMQTEEGLDLIIILIPAVLVVVIIGMIVCGIFINRRWNKKTKNEELGKEDPHLDGDSTEKVPMPMFEEDVPSVLELEMEELDEWMKKDG